MNSPILWLSLAAVYASLMYQAVQAGLIDKVVSTFIPGRALVDLPLFTRLFADKTIALLGWVHLMSMDLFEAR